MSGSLNAGPGVWAAFSVILVALIASGVLVVMYRSHIQPRIGLAPWIGYSLIFLIAAILLIMASFLAFDLVQWRHAQAAVFDGPGTGMPPSPNAVVAEAGGHSALHRLNDRS